MSDKIINQLEQLMAEAKAEHGKVEIEFEPARCHLRIYAPNPVPYAPNWGSTPAPYIGGFVLKREYTQEI